MENPACGEVNALSVMRALAVAFTHTPQSSSCQRPRFLTRGARHPNSARVPFSHFSPQSFMAFTTGSSASPFSVN